VLELVVFVVAVEEAAHLEGGALEDAGGAVGQMGAEEGAAQAQAAAVGRVDAGHGLVGADEVHVVVGLAGVEGGGAEVGAGDERAGQALRAGGRHEAE